MYDGYVPDVVTTQMGTPELIDRYIDRETSWLEFNGRVLALAEDPSTPLLERVKFLTIFATNLDEFYMVRVAGLKQQVAAGVTGSPRPGTTPRRQLQDVARRAEQQASRHARLFAAEIQPLLREADIHVLRWNQLDDVQRKELSSMFHEQIFPVVTPLAVDPAHPFPYVSNLSLNLAVVISDPVTGAGHFARVKVPPLLPRFTELNEGRVFVPLEDVIAGHLERLFPGMEVIDHHPFRVTRDTDLEVDDDAADDLLAAIEQELRRRKPAPVVRLEIEDSTPRPVLDVLLRELQISEDDVHRLPGPLDLAGLRDLYRLDHPELKDEVLQPVTHPDLTTPDQTPVDMFSVLREGDLLVHHPYQSFGTSVEWFVEQAANDPDVLAIKQTLYRTSNESAIVSALGEAAQAGKQVVVVVELRARFDEQANIGWARTLERAGCHVVYGVVGLKTHCKLCLVVRQEKGQIRRYVHVGTGNYNARTARIYEDLGVFTSNPRLGADVSDLFNSLTGYSRQTEYRCLVVAPHAMRERILALIEREIGFAAKGEDARIIMKLNSLVDRDVIDALYAASGAGVQVDLIVRGICSLIPGRTGLSENITVRSILGRFLEHSRILYFLNGGDEEIYIGSPDLMERNLDRRVETLIRTDAHELKERLRSTLALYLDPTIQAWTLDPNGDWRPPDTATQSLDLQVEMMKRLGHGA